MIDASTLSLGGMAGSISSGTDAAKANLNDTYNNFLVLLTTQLKNQDPLSPMDSKEFTGQLIQMSTAEQSIAQTKRIEKVQ
jgi:flagellar basal-body rod modification protein FlgD